MAALGLASQGARVPAAVVLTKLSRIISVSAPEGLETIKLADAPIITLFHTIINHDLISNYCIQHSDVLATIGSDDDLIPCL